MTGDHRRADPTSPRAAALRDLLNEWDFIGVVHHGVLDEYDCLIGPISDLLSRGAGRAELDAFLAAELRQHFGLDDSPTPARARFVAGVLQLRE